MKHYYLILFLAFLQPVIGQDDNLLESMGNDEGIEYTTASFKTNRVINLHSLENTAAGVLDFKINHRFGDLQGGIYNLFGLDNASMRISFDYGVTDQLVVGLGRSNLKKTFDAYAKYKFLRQSTGQRVMPVTAALVLGVACESQNSPEYLKFLHRMSYSTQLIVGRKISESFSLELAPTWIHRNLTETPDDKNDLIAICAGLRQKLSKRVAINAEYNYVLPNQQGPGYTNSFGVGFDIETGGHVFQLHFTNTPWNFEQGFIAATTAVPAGSPDWGVHFGFNLSRVFTICNKGKDVDW